MINVVLSLYALLSNVLYGLMFWPLFIYRRFAGDNGRILAQRLALYRPKILRAVKGTPRIWLHAASVGEVKAAISTLTVLKEKLPACGLILSTYTVQGHKSAKALTSRKKELSDTICILAPVDVALVVRRALGALKPDVMVFMETELWPNWLYLSQQKRIKTVLINGRISDRTIRGYLKIRPLIKAILAPMTAISVIGEGDYERFMRLGAAAERLTVSGNAKFDLLEPPDAAVENRLRFFYGLNGDEPVFVAGSIRAQEDGLMIQAYQQIKAQIPKALMILAPRHLNRVEAIEARLKEQGLKCQKRTELEQAGLKADTQVILLNTIGELQKTYSLASVVFCGGSLVPLGGQNILEPAAWGKPVLFGPSMGDFQEARDLLIAAGGAVEVQNVAELARHLIDFLNNPQKARIMGQKAQAAVMSYRGAAEKHAAVIMAAVNN